MAGIAMGRFRGTMEEYFEDHDLDMVCRKRRRGYSLYFADDDTPLVRLRPTGEEDIVELDWWDGNHWQPVTEFGLALPLVEALDYVTDDPDDVFFDVDDEEDDVISDEHPPHTVPLGWAARVGLRITLNATVGCSLLGAACGGMVAGAPWGLLYGAGAAVMFCLLYSLITKSIRGDAFHLVFSGLPSMVLAGASGSIGAALCQTWGGGLWPSVGGAIAALACAFFLTSGTWPAWLVGFIAGLNLGISLADSLDIRQQFLGVAMIALLAAGTASLCRILGDAIREALHDYETLGACETKREFSWRRQAPRS